MSAATLRRYQPNDEDASVALWLRTWQAAYPELDFAERLDWWRTRWRNELLPAAEVMIAEADGNMIGFVTVDPRTFYLDQIVVAPEHWRPGVGALSTPHLSVNFSSIRRLRLCASSVVPGSIG